MATYKYGKYESWDGYVFYAIKKKTFLFGWEVQKRWPLYHVLDYNININFDTERKELMDAVDRLIKAGHTVI